MGLVVRGIYIGLDYIPLSYDFLRTARLGMVGSRMI